MTLRPVCRWAGGKARMAPQIVEIIGEISGTYWEPMAGMGAVFLELRNAGFTGRAVLGDASAAVRNVWVSMKHDHEALHAFLLGLGNVSGPLRHGLVRAVYNALPESSTLRAAHLIWLMAASHGGVYRVNAAGEFNVPPQQDRQWTKDKPVLLPLPDKAMLDAVRDALVNAELLEDAQPLVYTLRSAAPGDVIYLDPPYADSFAYGGRKWTINQLRDLVQRLEQLVADRPGLRVVLTEADRPQVRDLLGRLWDVRGVDLGSGISRGVDKARKEIIAYLGG